MSTATANYRQASPWITERYLAGHVSIPGAVETDHGLMIPVTRDNLNDLMEFDHVIQVHEDGTITEPSGIYAPGLWNGEIDSDEWEPFGNYTSQQGGGWFMHDCESIGSRMADDILATPGIYVVIVGCWYPETDDDQDPETDYEGWAVARLRD